MPNIFLKRFMIAPTWKVRIVYSKEKKERKKKGRMRSDLPTVRLLSTVVSTLSDDICENFKCIHILR